MEAAERTRRDCDNQSDGVEPKTTAAAEEQEEQDEVEVEAAVQETRGSDTLTEEATTSEEYGRREELSEGEPEAEAETESEVQPLKSETATRSILNAATDTSSDEEEPNAESPNKQVKTAEEEEEEEDVIPPAYGEKGIKYTLNELFVNPNLKCKSAHAVLRKDPFAIPRATDNVTEYRPRFNPLSILVSEEKLLPRDFTFDFSEGIPGMPKPSGKEQASKNVTTTSEEPASEKSESLSYLVRKVAPIRNPQTFGDKLATMGLLMGSMPRQAQPSPTPLINTPTVHNPFGEPLMELVASDPAPTTIHPLRPPTADTPVNEAPISNEFDLGDMSGISGLSKLSIAANAASADSMYGSSSYHAYSTSGPSAAYGPPRMPPTPPPMDGLMNYLPSHFAEKRGPISAQLGIPASHYEPLSNYHYPQDQNDYRDSLEEQQYAPQVQVPPADMPQSHYEQPATAAAMAANQSLQPISKKPRSKNVFRPCSAPGCTKGARGKSGLCQKHGGGKRCAAPNCPKGAQGSSSFCLFHGGGYRCTVPGCTTGARGTSGLCAKHGGYKRAREGLDEHGQGNLEGGQAAKNPRLDYVAQAVAEATG